MRDWIVVLGAETPSGQAVARKLRAEHYCCKLMASGVGVDEIIRESPAGLILAGEETEGAIAPTTALLGLSIPLLALGSSARALCTALGTRGEGEETTGAVEQMAYQAAPIFEDVGAGERWIERAEPFTMPEPYRVIAEGARFPLAFADDAASVYLLQFQIERNDPDGMSMLLGFVDAVCGCTAWWTADSILQMAERAIREGVGDGEAICAMSGGLDSTVAAVIAKRVLGDRVACVLVDTGLMREGESEAAERYLRDELSLPFTRVDVSDRVLAGLRGLTSLADKRRVIEEEIFRALKAQTAETGRERVFIKGTNYVDVLGGAHAVRVERIGKTVEPLMELFKEEIRMLGEALALSPSVIHRQPFPGMGLAARIQGEVTAGRLRTLRLADELFLDELTEAGLNKRLKRYFAMLDTGEGRDRIILRAMQGEDPGMTAARLPYDLLERTVERIHKELPSVDRVLYDMTPGAAEWSA